MFLQAYFLPQGRQSQTFADSKHSSSFKKTSSIADGTAKRDGHGPALPTATSKSRTKGENPNAAQHQGPPNSSLAPQLDSSHPAHMQVPSIPRTPAARPLTSPAAAGRPAISTPLRGGGGGAPPRRFSSVRAPWPRRRRRRPAAGSCRHGGAAATGREGRGGPPPPPRGGTGREGGRG